MEPAAWQRARQTFLQLTELPAWRRTEEAQARLRDEPELLLLVSRMLGSDAEEQPLLDAEDGSVVERMARASVLIMAPVPGGDGERRVGPYRLGRLLGEGGMGVVYLATRDDLDGVFAVKLLRDAWLSPMRRERFHAEQQTLLRLNHPAIARMYEASTARDGTPYFAMEYVEGVPITTFAQSRSGRVLADLLLLEQVCEAVGYAHSLAVIHRDLKPSNILVTAAAGVKLLDFGIAKELGKSSGGELRTVAGLRLLTPIYAAPEQEAGDSVGVFTDVYSLGVLLFEVLSGELPATGMPRLGAGGARGARELGRKQWAELELICRRAMEAEPARRYRSAEALQADLRAFAEGRPVQARRGGAMYRARKFASRHWRSLSLAIATLLLVAGLSLTFTVRLARAKRAAVAEAKRTQTIQRFLQNMLGDSDGEAGPANGLTVATLLDRATVQAGQLRADAATQVKLFETLGNMYARMGRFAEAQALLGKAHDRAQASGDTPEALLLAVQQAGVRADRGDVEGAQAEVRAALLQLRSAQDPQTLAKAEVIDGRIAVEAGEYARAADELRAVLTENAIQSDAYVLRDDLSTLGEAEVYLQHYSEAEQSTRRALALDEQLLGRDHPRRAEDLADLASVKASQGFFGEAVPMYREALATLTAWDGPDHPDAIMMASLLARSLTSERNYVEAESLLADVLARHERLYGRPHERIAFTLDAMGNLEEKLGHLSAAEADFRRGLAIWAALGQPTNPRAAGTASNLAELLLREGKAAQAEGECRRAESVLAALSPAPPYLGLNRARWGEALLALGRYDEAERELLSGQALMKQMAHPPRELARMPAALALVEAARRHRLTAAATLRFARGAD